MIFQQLCNDGDQRRDFVVVSMPLVDTDMPLMAPAVIKSTVESMGLTCLAADINQEVYQYINDNPQRASWTRFFFENTLDQEIIDQAYQMFDSLSDQILAWQPRYVGLSLLTFLSQTATRWLAYFIKKKKPDVVIIIGGVGCQLELGGSTVFVDDMFRWRLIDHYIKGDAEISLKKLLEGDTDYPGIDLNTNSWREMTREELESLPYADYSDYHMQMYTIPAVGIISSRGCVRNCTFCDFIVNWKKFQWRSADNVWQEMQQQIETYDIRGFKFNDSLVNGNQREWLRLCEHMANYNATHDDKIHWTGFYIFRNRSATSEREWELLKQSGCLQLDVGLESVIERIRYHMGKKFDNESLDFHLDQALKYKINCTSLMLVGYVNETEQDVEQTKIWLTEHQRYKDVLSFNWGTGLGIYGGTGLDRRKKELGIKMIGSSPHEWVSEHHENTPEIRQRRTLELLNHAKKLGFVCWESGFNQHFLLEKSLA